MPGPDDDRTRRVGAGDDPDATRQVDPTTARGEADATRQLDPTDTGAGYDPRRTRAMEASVGTGTATGAAAGADPHDPDTYDEVETDEEAAARDKRRDWLIGAAGVVVGLILAVIIALFVSGGDEDLDTVAAEERIEALEGERDELDARVVELEGQLADADAAAAGADADLDAQRDALAERQAALDDRAAALDEREAAIAEREEAVAEREARADDGQAPPPGDGDGDGDGDGEGGFELPDAEEVEGFFSQLADRIASLFD